jgi:putative transposase
MGFDSLRHHRRSIRLEGYDYTQDGAYFVTICVNGRLPLFGEIHDGEMHPNDAGRMLETYWNALPDRFPNIEPDVFIVMPNHIHGIVFLVGAPLVGALSPDTQPLPLGNLLGAFKSLTTNAYIHGVKTLAWTPFETRLWQRNYFERVIRSDQELDDTRAYIQGNPLCWPLDEENPNR